ncbi:MAG: hypothetical protein HXX13_03155 [Bacteroidetes bacterium]|nr:hypothetical protein [Bacteroidota bacterium]
MKTCALILFVATVFTVLFSGCRNCYPCLASGENFDVPYYLGQSVKFKNDVDSALSLTGFNSGYLPPDEYCGRIGSGSYGACRGDRFNGLTKGQDSLIVKIYCASGSGDDVEQPVSRQVSVLEGSIRIIKGVASASTLNSAVYKVESLTVNGIQYSNVYEYSNATAGLNQCTNFVFSMNYGVLKFSVKRDNSIENWVLVH